MLGVGNILLSDEGIGVRVIEELQRRYTFPSNVEVIDGGTGSIHLLSLIEEAEFLIVVDAVDAEESPGTVLRFTRQEDDLAIRQKTSLHQLGVLEVLNIAKVHKRCPPAVIVGIQPKDLSPGLSLSPELGTSITRAIEAVIAELDELGAKPSATAEH